MKIVIECDVCHKSIKLGIDWVDTDYDDCDRCKICYLKDCLRNIEEEIKEKQDWLRNTHLNGIEDLESDLRAIAKELKNEQD